MPPTPVASDKRQYIIETAYALFKQSGFHATGIDRIIAEANVAKMTMYRHFPSKDGLIVAVLAWRAERFDRQLARLAQQPCSPEEKIAALFDWYEAWFQRPDFRGCLFAHALAEFGDRAHPVFQAAFDQKLDLKRRLQQILQATMPPKTSETISATLLMLIEGATLLAEMGQADIAVSNAREAAATLIGSASLSG
jgi:AcrR family transcriptional regulator